MKRNGPAHKSCMAFSIAFCFAVIAIELASVSIQFLSVFSNQ